MPGRRAKVVLRRGLQVVSFFLVVLPLWFTLERLEYAKEVRQFFSHVPGHAWFIPLALLLGFVLEMVVEMVASSGVRRWHKGKVKTKT
jgi:fumarate reductase subunit D